MLQVIDNKTCVCVALTSVMMFGSANLGYNDGVIANRVDFGGIDYTFGYCNEVDLENRNCCNNFVFGTYDSNGYDRVSANNSVLSAKNGTIETVRSFGDLVAGWDGYSGLPIDKEVMSFAMELIVRLPEQIEAFPLSSGNIQLQCENDSHDYFELEVLPNRNIELFIEWSNGEVFEKSICYNDSFEQNELLDLVVRFQG